MCAGLARESARNGAWLARLLNGFVVSASAGVTGGIQSPIGGFQSQPSTNEVSAATLTGLQSTEYDSQGAGLDGYDCRSTARDSQGCGGSDRTDLLGSGIDGTSESSELRM